MRGLIQFFSKVMMLSGMAAKRFKANYPLHLAGSTAFFAMFSLAPILIIILQIISLILRKPEVNDAVMSKLEDSLPHGSAEQLNSVISGFANMSGHWYFTLLLLVLLVFSATTLFSVIETALERIWRVRKSRSLGFLNTLQQRLFSLTLILAAGFLLVLAFIGRSIQISLQDKVASVSPVIAAYFGGVYRYVVSFTVAAVWFAFVFRYLTHVRLQWKTALAGAIYTSILFNMGKEILQAILNASSIISVFGASASLVLLLLFVFYISLIIYFGAAFTVEWAQHHQQKISMPSYMQYYTIEEQQQGS